MAGPTELLERGLELIENPAALIGAMDHHDVLGHGLCPLASSQVKPAWRSGMRGQGQAPPEETPGARAASSAPLSPASRCGTAIGSTQPRRVKPAFTGGRQHSALCSVV